jgi:hypothetical protein
MFSFPARKKGRTWSLTFFLSLSEDVYPETMNGGIRASPAARRISDVQIIRCRPFASPNGRPNYPLAAFASLK